MHIKYRPTIIYGDAVLMEYWIILYWKVLNLILVDERQPWQMPLLDTSCLT